MLEILRGAGVLDALDVALARTLAGRCGEESPLALLAAAAASRAVQDGHVCADLAGLALQPMTGRDGEPVEGRAWPELAHWLQALDGSPLFGDGERATPLVRRGTRIYLQRYHQHEQALAMALLARREPLGTAQDALRELLDGFPRPQALAPTQPDWQKVAIAVAATRSLALITGGPGTGKTTVVARLLAVAWRLAADADQAFHPLLLAPTGKAAARLHDSLRAQWDSLPEDLRPPWKPPKPKTIHAALGVVPGARQRFRHHRGRPLPADLVLVDEASMVDLALMRRLVDAVEPTARLVLLGDPGQLVSVESGAVLGELVKAAHCRSAGQRSTLEALTGESLPPSGSPSDALGDVAVELQHSFRFDEDRGIGALARALRRGDGAQAVRVLESPAPDVSLVERPAPRKWGALQQAVVEAYTPLATARTPREALDALDSFRILCAHRRGAWGLEVLTPMVESALSHAGLLQPSAGVYTGRPLLVTRNDYDQQLFNGDQGVLMPDPDDPSADPQLWAWFRSTEEHAPPRRLSPSRLPPHESAWVLTIHKSQGSELDRLWVWMPPVHSPLATRELLYTAVTRARSQVCVIGSPEEVTRAVSREVARWSGLSVALAAPVSRT